MPETLNFMPVARRLYTEAPPVMRWLQTLRPAISPFGTLIDSVAPGSRVLDVGCGGGLFLALLADQGRIGRGTGFDASRPAIDAARAMAASSGLDAVLEFQHLSVESPWPAGPFDVVSLIDVLHHIPRSEQRRVIEQAADCVTPGGVLLYKDMADTPWWGAAMNRLHDLVVARDWIHYAPLEDVRSWLEGKGLVAERSFETRMYWYCHEMIVFRRPDHTPTAA